MVLDREARDRPWQRLTALQGPKKCWSETASICSGIRVQRPCFCALSQGYLECSCRPLLLMASRTCLVSSFKPSGGLPPCSNTCFVSACHVHLWDHLMAGHIL